MRCYLPQTLDELHRDLALLGPSGRIIGGGTDFILASREGQSRPEALLYPGGIPHLTVINETPEGLSIGAAVTMTQLAETLKDRPQWAALAQAGAEVGSEQIRNRATLGGNIANASPAGDLLPVLWLLSAEVGIAGPVGVRCEKIDQFIQGPGRTSLAPNEAVIAFHVPARVENSTSAFAKIGSRRLVTISRLGVAVRLSLAGNIINAAEVVLGAVAETPLKAGTVEKELAGSRLNSETLGRAGRALSRLILDVNKRANREYKAWVGPGLLADACARLNRRAE